MFDVFTLQPDCPEHPLSFQLNAEQSAVFTVQPEVTPQLHSLNTEQSLLVQEQPEVPEQVGSSHIQLQLAVSYVQPECPDSHVVTSVLLNSEQAEPAYQEQPP